jgi:GNAT superfamily N-acetyltransferase
VSLPEWHEEPLSRLHDRDGFDCNAADLNDYLKRHARQNHDSGGAKSFVAVLASDGKSGLGFYSLSPASIAYSRTPASARRGLGRYDVPVFRLNRLAIARKLQGRGLGGQLLLAAGRRCLRVAAEVGGVALLIDAKDEPAASWYAGHGALPLLDAPLSLVLPLGTIERALAAG